MYLRLIKIYILVNSPMAVISPRKSKLINKPFCNAQKTVGLRQQNICLFSSQQRENTYSNW